MLKQIIAFTKDELDLLECAIEDELNYWTGPDEKFENLLYKIGRAKKRIITKQIALERLPEIKQ